MKHYCTKLFIRAMVLLKAIQTGMHIAFLVGMIQLLFGQRPVSSVAGILLVWFFVFMTGASASAVRAGIMQTILLTAPLVRRENDGPTSLAAALDDILRRECAEYAVSVCSSPLPPWRGWFCWRSRLPRCFCARSAVIRRADSALLFP